MFGIPLHQLSPVRYIFPMPRQARHLLKDIRHLKFVHRKPSQLFPEKLREMIFIALL